MSEAKTAFRDFRDGEESRFVSDLIHDQVPSYYVDEGPLFIKMIQEYYNYAHTGGNFEAAAKNMIKLNDVDEVAEYYEQYLADSGGLSTSSNTAWTAAGSNFIASVEDLWRKQYLLNFPQNTASFHLFLKNIIDVYRAKGSVEGFTAMMRGIYGIDTTIRNPFERTLKPSDGVWEFDEYLQVPYSSKIEEWKGRFIYGTSSGAQARVENVIKKNVKGTLFAQLLLTDISPLVEFEHNETLYTKEDSGFRIKCIAGIKGIELSANGSEFIPGEERPIIGSGSEGKVTITASETFNGRLSFTLNEAGTGYRANSIVTLIGGVGGTGASFKVGGIKEPFRNVVINSDIAGALFTNSQIQIGEANSFFTNGQVTSTTAYLNAPIAGPNAANGLNVSWNANSNDAKLDDDVANGTFSNGSSWMLGNTTVGNSGHFATLVVQDYFPGNSTIRFTSNIPTKASTNTAVIRADGANSVFTFGANLAKATVSSALNSALQISTEKLGAINFIITTSTGSGYIIAPEADITDTEVFRLRIPDGAGGFLGDNAIVDVALLANNVITNLKVTDHGLGFTNTVNITIPASVVKGTAARGKLIMGGVARNSGGWTETSGFLDSNQKIHDSDRFQAFSYEVVGEESLLTFKKTMTSIAHIAGTKMFGIFQNQGTADTNLGNETEITVANEQGGIEIANNGNIIRGIGTTYGGSSDIAANSVVTTNGLRFRVQTVTSNVALVGNGFVSSGISNSSSYVSSPFSANQTISGNVTATQGSAVVTGQATLFNNQVKAGYNLYHGTTNLGVVGSVDSQTQLTLKSALSTSSVNSSDAVYIVYPNEPILSGNVALAKGNHVITGTLTNFIDEVKKGDILVTDANVRIGTVNTVPTSTQIRLSNTYTGSTLSNENGIRVFCNRPCYQAFELSGETSIGDGSFNLVGQHTEFDNELQTGDKLFYQGNNVFIGTVHAVTSNTSANLMVTYTSPNGTDLSDARILRRHKLSELIIQNGNNI